jgi:hypothetical protein
MNWRAVVVDKIPAKDVLSEVPSLASKRINDARRS